MSTCWIYMFTFPNGKRYIGQTRYGKLRWTQHKNAAHTPENASYSFPLYSAIRKYGWDNVQKEVLLRCSPDELNDKEAEYIADYNTMSPNGYNMNSGGDSFTMSEETKAKIGAAVKAHQANLSPTSLKAWKDKVRLKHIGKHNLSNESKNQISDSLKSYYDAHPQSDETKDKRSASHRKYGKGLPRYVGVRKYASGNVYCISKHPLVKYEQFHDLESCLQRLEFLNLRLQIRELENRLTKLSETNKQVLETLDAIVQCIENLKQTIVQ